jgi:hypothetical protein
MKSNDKIPKDEMLLAEMIAAASANKMTSCQLALFRDKNFQSIRDNCSIRYASKCCAFGALILAGKAKMVVDKRGCVTVVDYPSYINNIRLIDGNDSWLDEWHDGMDAGETLGYVFYRAMTDVKDDDVDDV